MYTKYFCDFCNKEFSSEVQCKIHEKVEHEGYPKDASFILGWGHDPCEYCAHAYYVYGCEQECEHKKDCLEKHKWAKFEFNKELEEGK